MPLGCVGNLVFCNVLFGTLFLVADLLPEALATIYNTVHAFKNNGYLKEISLQGNKTFFDTNSKSHHHFYDQDTGDLIDIKNEDISINKLPSAPKGKKINEVEVTVSVANNNQNQENN